MTDFVVDPVIVSLTRQLADWPLCRVFLYNDSRYQWGLLVPRRPGAVEMCDLPAEDQQQLMTEIVRLSNLIRPLPGVEKLNVGNLGNMVTQLHVHVIGRRSDDPFSKIDLCDYLSSTLTRGSNRPGERNVDPHCRIRRDRRSSALEILSRHS